MSAALDIRFFRDMEEGRRAEILDAALAVFAERGYEGGSMREIAERVGISEPGLYRYVSGKEELFLTVIERTGSRIHEEVGPLLDAVEPATLHATLGALLENRREAARTYYVPVIQTILVASAHNPVFLDAYRRSIVEPMADRLQQRVPVFDAHFGVGPHGSTERERSDELRRRVLLLMSLFAGYFVMSYVFDEDEVPVADGIMRVMGWKCP